MARRRSRSLPVALTGAFTAAVARAACGGHSAAPAAPTGAMAAPPDLRAVEQQFEGALLPQQRRALLAELQSRESLIEYVLAMLQHPRDDRFPWCARLA